MGQPTKVMRQPTKALLRDMWVDMCPKYSYWHHGCSKLSCSLEMCNHIAMYMDDMEVDVFLQKCKKGSFTDEEMEQLLEGLEDDIIGDGVIFCYDYAVSKENVLDTHLERSRRKLFEYAKELDMDNKPNIAKTGEALEKHIDILLQQYNYVKIGQYYFYILAFDGPELDIQLILQTHNQDSDSDSDISV